MEAKFKFLNKTLFCEYADKIFEILADNMSIIAPTGNTRDEDFKIWYHAISEEIKNDNREIILILENETNNIIGFFKYSTTIDTFVMEEIQLCDKFQGSGNIFRDLYSFVLKNICNELMYVEAFADKRNHKSIGILKKLGLKVIGENKNGISFHFKGSFIDLKNWHLNQNPKAWR